MTCPDALWTGIGPLTALGARAHLVVSLVSIPHAP